MPSEAPLSVRPAEPADADALAALYLASREASYPAIPPSAHPPGDVRRWMRGRVDAPGTEVWLAEQHGEQSPVGLLLLEGDWLHSLYVAPGRTHEGIGAVLLDLAKARLPRRIGLWVFEANQDARRFYRRHGFVEVRHTDGTGPDGNEEQAPDVEMAWPDPQVLSVCRARIGR